MGAYHLDQCHHQFVLVVMGDRELRLGGRGGGGGGGGGQEELIVRTRPGGGRGGGYECCQKGKRRVGYHCSHTQSLPREKRARTAQHRHINIQK